MLNYQLKRWAQWFAPNNHYHAFRQDSDNLIFEGLNNQKHQIAFLAIDLGIAIEPGWLWDVLAIYQENGTIFRFGGVAKGQSCQLQAELNQQIGNYLERYYHQFEPALQRAAQEARVLFSGQHYIRHRHAEKWITRHQQLTLGIRRKDCLSYLNANSITDYQQIYPLIEQGYQYVAQINQTFVEQQEKRFQDFFDTVESNPLTGQQRKACLIDEQHNLILAGAGTGKTSTMIGRAGYLLKAGLAKPRQILMLAYARKAAEEMEQRIKDKLEVEQLAVKTFHSLGKHIITEVEGRVPTIHKMAEDETLRARFVDDQVQKFLQDELYKSRFVTYFLRFAYPYQSPYNFNSLGAYNAYLQENDLRTLQGELVKSYEECEIANFLYRQGINYQYEANYQVNTSGPDYKVYQPDFYLPDYGIYIEHFAVNENDQTPPFIEQKAYLDGMAWKRGLHEAHQTSLIETYSYFKQQGRLTDVLDQKLKEAGVQFKPLPQNELLQKLNQLGRVSEFSQLMAQILGLFKSAFLNIKEMVELANGHEDHERMRAAAYLFEPIYEAYQQELQKTGCIDFDDMIGLAIGHVESGRYQSKYRYLLVDEFQDISASRARLLKGLLAQQPDSSLFCVGDDWQSIYRFTGSDVSITKNFVAFFGAAATSVLDKTFRFNNQIGELASRFVMQNPSQIEKQIHSLNRINHSAVSLIKTNQDIIGIHAALTAISAKSKDSASVLLLARFSFRKPDIASLNRQFPLLKIQFMTVHAAKGKEADYVLVLGLEKGIHGFPSEKAAHPLLELLLPKAGAFPYEEERRLFYVALTRARHHVYLITDGNKPSPFVRELIDNRYNLLTDEFKGEGFQDTITQIVCTKCQTGYMVSRDGPHGSFFGCSEYPLCSHTQRACQWCGGSLQQKGRFRACENPRCDYVEPICPDCGGTLSLRKSQYGQFWGCSNYRKGAEFSCSHTEKFIDLQAVKTK